MNRRGGGWLQAGALAIGWGGVSLASRATGLSRLVIVIGIKELYDRSERIKVPIRKSKACEIRTDDRVRLNRQGVVIEEMGGNICGKSDA